MSISWTKELIIKWKNQASQPRKALLKSNHLEDCQLIVPFRRNRCLLMVEKRRKKVVKKVSSSIICEYDLMISFKYCSNSFKKYKITILFNEFTKFFILHVYSINLSFHFAPLGSISICTDNSAGSRITSHRKQL